MLRRRCLGPGQCSSSMAMYQYSLGQICSDLWGCWKFESLLVSDDILECQSRVRWTEQSQHGVSRSDCSEGCSCALVPAKQGEQGGDKHFHHEQSRGLLGWLLVAAENFTNVDAEIDFFFFNRNVASYEVPKCTHFSKQFSLKLGICRCLKHACFSPVWVLNLKFVLQTKLWPVEPTKDNWETSRKTNPKGFKRQ